MTWDPDGRVAVVTGASSGIGEATARRLSAAGMTVVAVARRADRLDALAGSAPGDVRPYVADVTDTDAVDELARRTEAEFGACHALIANAGVPGRAFEGRGDLDAALHTLDVNLGGVVRCAAAFADLLARSAPSRLVNVGSVLGKVGVGPAAYAASKFGVVGFSEALALNWRQRGIAVCQLNPGFITTEGFPQTRLRRSPLGRLVGDPEDVAAAVEEVLRSGARERTVPRWYRAVAVIRHVVPPAWQAGAARMARARRPRD